MLFSFLKILVYIISIIGSCVSSQKYTYNSETETENGPESINFLMLLIYLRSQMHFILGFN